MKRILLFLLTNLAVMATISLVINLLGLNRYLTATGIDYPTLLMFCLVWGMGGAFISLLLSKSLAKMSMGVKIINPQNATGSHATLVSTVHRLARQAGLSGMPEVGVYESLEPNAFATGANRNNALVAVSTGLLQRMTSDELEGVLGHEVSHIANGDMVTMTLLQGVVNAFALFLARIIAFAVSSAVSRSDNENGFSSGIYFVVSFVLDILLTILGSMVVAAFSRSREFRADAGGAKLAGRSKMVNALKRLEQVMGAAHIEDQRGDTLNTLKINHRSAWLGLFATHPPLKTRIAKLQSEY